VSDKTFAQAIFEAAKNTADSEAGRLELAGLSRDQFVGSVRSLSEALDKMPPNTSLHMFLMAVTFMRNALILAMTENQKRLEAHKGDPK
jgi:hypothetical protein